MRFLTQRYSFPIPHPPQMNNNGNYIVSLSQFTAWLGGIAEELGVELYPGFAGSSLVYTEDGHGIAGVRLNDVGLNKRGEPKDSFEPGMEFRAKVTLLAEGARGSLTKTAVRRFQLQKDSDPQTYGFGVKEVWRVDPSQYRPGEVVHTMGWPLDMSTYGGGWVYHMADGLVSLGLVIGLDYANPYLSPYRELQVSFPAESSRCYSLTVSTAHEAPSILCPATVWRLDPSRIWCPHSQRRRFAISPEAAFPRWRVDWVLSRVRQRRQNQRHSQCDEDGHVGRRSSLRRNWRRERRSGRHELVRDGVQEQLGLLRLARSPQPAPLVQHVARCIWRRAVFWH